MNHMIDDNRFVLIEKYKQKLIEGTNISDRPEEMAVIDSILFRLWQMGWLDKLEEETKWIPCSERLPETSDAVLTTYIVNGDRSRKYVEESSYYGNDESWSSPWDEYRIAGTRIEVIAWMPLPEPYKGVTG